MSKLLVTVIISFIVSTLFSFSEETPKVKQKESSPYSIEVNVSGIPKGHRTLFIPIMIDAMILDFDKVALEGLQEQNILAVASTSKDKVGTGIGLLKLDENDIPGSLKLKVLLKRVGYGQTDVSLLKVAPEPALLTMGAVINDEVVVSVASDEEVEITEKLENNKKRLVLSQNKLTIDIKRQTQKEETIFIPISFNKEFVDLDETFGHAIFGPGVAAKSFSSASLHEGGPGVEIVLNDVADKDFTVDVDLIPKKTGKTKLTLAYPQRGHTALVTGPVVEITPKAINVSSTINVE